MVGGGFASVAESLTEWNKFESRKSKNVAFMLGQGDGQTQKRPESHRRSSHRRSSRRNYGFRQVATPFPASQPTVSQSLNPSSLKMQVG